jgi:hypothetical protein
VNVSGDDSISEPKDVIVAKFQFTFLSPELSLYCARRDEKRLSSKDEDLTVLQDPSFSETSPYLEIEMNPLADVREYFPDDEIKEPKTIHVLVKLPVAGSTCTASEMVAQGRISSLARSPKRLEPLMKWVRASDACPQLHLEDDGHLMPKDDKPPQLACSSKTGSKKAFISILWVYL